MGIGGSKTNCIGLSLHRPRSKIQISHHERTGVNNDNNASQPERNSEATSGELSRTSLRRVSHSSIKPGLKLSMGSSQTQLKLKDETLFDPEDLISIHDLYNMLNDGSMKPFIYDPFNLLLVDSRDLQYFLPNHVITAKHHATVLGNTNVTMRLSNYSMIIIYGNELRDDADTKELANVKNDITEYVAGDILILKEGFDVFHTVYPFLCTDKLIESIADRKLLVSYPSAILENQLYQGRGDQATNESIISLLGITHIVNISMEHKNAFTGKIKYLKIALEDVSETNLFQHFYEASSFIDHALSKGGRVLVHCNQGVSRSSTITLTYLMRFKKWDLEHAFSILKARRSCSCPNVGFFKQLSTWEEEIFGKRITNIDSL